jgi:hypothetical protein
VCVCVCMCVCVCARRERERERERARESRTNLYLQVTSLLEHATAAKSCNRAATGAHERRHSRLVQLMSNVS